MGGKLPEGWGIKQFLECIEKEASSNKLKIPKSEFQNKGEYPIIDQGTEYIAGYTDNPLKVYKGELPVIIFGDHTRIFKFVGFPFSLGADGTKVLVPKKDLLYPKYFYFFLHRLKIESHGYSRHYKFLKEKQIVIPPLQTQKKIVSILEKADETKKLRMQADELTNQLLQSVFLEMFGDPVKNPKEFDFVQLKTVYSKEKLGTKCGPFGSALKKHEYVRHGIPVLTMDAICENKFINKHDLFITKEKYEQLTPYLVEKRDIIISRAGTVGKMCVANPSVHPSIIGTNLIRLSLDFSKIEPIYFTSLMTYCKGRVGRLKSGSDGAYTFMNTGILNNLDIPLPPLALQQKFAQIVEKVEAMRQNQKQSQQEINNLFNALIQKAFKGELVA